MSGKTWVCADHHFGHTNILSFKRPDGSPLRDFKSIEEHDETIIANHNALVAPTDRVYILGDLAMRRGAVSTVDRLNGRKVLVKGNHDIFKLKDYTPYFDDIRAYVVQLDQQKNKVILSHIPVHPETLGRFGVNIHGHLHCNRVLDVTGNVDPMYRCVSLEHTDFKPREIHEVLKDET